MNRTINRLTWMFALVTALFVGIAFGILLVDQFDGVSPARAKALRADWEARE